MHEGRRQDWQTPPEIKQAIVDGWGPYFDPFSATDDTFAVAQRRASGCKRWMLALENTIDPAKATRSAAKACASDPCGPGCGWAPWPSDVPIFLQGPWCAAVAQWQRWLSELGRRCVIALLPDSGSSTFGEVVVRAPWISYLGRISFDDPLGDRKSPPPLPIWMAATVPPSAPIRLDGAYTLPRGDRVCHG